jgi:hypothetical protein
MDVIQAQTPGELPCWRTRPTSRGGGWMESWKVQYVGTSCTQPADQWAALRTNTPAAAPGSPAWRTYARSPQFNSTACRSFSSSIAETFSYWYYWLMATSLAVPPPRPFLSNTDTVPPVRNELGDTPKSHGVCHQGRRLPCCSERVWGDLEMYMLHRSVSDRSSFAVLCFSICLKLIFGQVAV